LKARLFAMRDGTLTNFSVEEIEIEGDPANPPRTIVHGGRRWHRFYEFGLPEPLSYLDVEANKKAVVQLLRAMVEGKS
jgi:hypothetical protein